MLLVSSISSYCLVTIVVWSGHQGCHNGKKFGLQLRNAPFWSLHLKSSINESSLRLGISMKVTINGPLQSLNLGTFNYQISSSGIFSGQYKELVEDE